MLQLCRSMGVLSPYRLLLYLKNSFFKVLPIAGYYSNLSGRDKTPQQERSVLSQRSSCFFQPLPDSSKLKLIIAFKALSWFYSLHHYPHLEVQQHSGSSTLLYFLFSG